MSYALFNGKIILFSEVHISPNDHGFLYGDGIYEALRTVNRKVFDLSTHLTRLRHSAETLQIDFPYTDKEIKKWIEELIKKSPLDKGGLGDLKNSELRIRISLTRGENHFEFTGSKSPTLLITANPLPKYDDQYTEGVSITSIDIHRLLPEVKSIALMPMVLAKQKAKKENCFECLFVENGYVTEGATSNIIAKNKNEIWVTPKEKALPGTAQKIFIEKAKIPLDKGGLEDFIITEKNFTITDLQTAEEVAITNSIYGILEVKEICGQKRQLHKDSLFKKIQKDFWK